MGKQIIVLGGGYAGVLTAKKLARRFKKQADIRITIVDKNRYHTMLTELHEVAANRVEEDSIRISLRKIFAGRGVDVVTDTISKIDYDANTLIGEVGQYRYDYLVLASGSQPAFYGIPGAAEHTFKLWSYTDAIKLRAHIVSTFERAMNETNPAEKQRLLTFYISGAGFTGVEMAGELAEWIPQLCEQFEIEPSEVKIVEVDLLDRVVPALSEALSAKAQRRLEKMGVTVLLKTTIQSIGPDYIELKQGDQIIREAVETVIWTAGTEGAGVARDSAGVRQVGRGRIQADEYLQAEGRPNVFLAGDSLFYIPKGAKSPVPQMVENCEHSASTVAGNLAVAITGQGEKQVYAPSFHGVMVCIGGRYGLAYVGGAKKIALPSFLAMFVKHFINLVYFLQVLGWNKIFSYLQHEFFTIRNCRSFVGGHFSNRTPSFLLVPLRMYLGFVWLYEAIVKINEGWLTAPKLFQFFKGASDLFNTILSGGASAAAETDAVASASATAAQGSVLANWNILGIFRFILIQASDVAMKIQFGPMDWFKEKVILGSGDAMLFFQAVIVVSEILIGLSLLGGLLTTVSAAYSLILQVMFVMTTGLYMGTWWMVFAAIAVLIAGGRTFGFDYYVMPWLKKQWKKIKWVRKSYLYHD